MVTVLPSLSSNITSEVFDLIGPNVKIIINKSNLVLV